MADEITQSENEAVDAEAEAPPMNRAERRAAAKGKPAPAGHQSYGQKSVGGQSRPGMPSSPQHKRGTTPRKSGSS